MWLREDTLITNKDDDVDVSELINAKLVKDEFITDLQSLQDTTEEREVELKCPRCDSTQWNNKKWRCYNCWT